jgi:hypothetical protein
LSSFFEKPFVRRVKRREAHPYHDTIGLDRSAGRENRPHAAPEGKTDAADFAGFWLRHQRIGTRSTSNLFPARALV